MNKLSFLFTLCFSFLLAVLYGQPTSLKPRTEILKLIDRNLVDAVAQYKLLMKHIPDDRMPETFDRAGNWKSVAPGGWVSGFYTATLFYLYSAVPDEVIYQEGIKRLKLLEPVKYRDSHDIGFMMYCSYGNANKIKPSPAYRDILLTSAATLARRFNPTVGCTLSWASRPGEFKVIIDNMMNLELLLWATKASGDSLFAKIAVSHANTTLKNHFRPDHSSFHLVNYNPQTGEVIRRQTVQGYADESALGRGQAWALYGFTMMYRETGDPIYLDQAGKVADFILHHPNLPKDKIPYWDFNAPGIPNALRDASAGAIYASALIELAGYTEKAKSKKYLRAAETIIATLSSPAFKAPYGDNGGFLLKHSVGNLPAGESVDLPLTYADYYFVEAMLRYKRLAK